MILLLTKPTTGIAALCITRSPLVGYPCTGTTRIKLTTDLFPSSVLMGVGIASTLVQSVRNEYNNLQSWLEG